jgi:hypothetical protein
VSLLSDIRKRRLRLRTKLPSYETNVSLSLLKSPKLTAIDIRPVRLWDDNPDIDKLTPVGGEEWALAPFPLTWIEDARGNFRTGTLVLSQPELSDGFSQNLFMQSSVMPRQALVITSFIEAVDIKTVSVAAWIRIPLDENGCTIRSPGSPTTDMFMVWFPDCASGEIRDEAVHNSREEVLTVFSLLNAKNINLGPVPAQARSGRNGKPITKQGVVWHRLNIRIPKASTERGYEWGELSEVNRAHTVRGHWKVFSTAAPLFGRLTGRFWWPPHARGDHDKGSVKKEYVLTPEDLEPCSETQT